MSDHDEIRMPPCPRSTIAQKPLLVATIPSMGELMNEYALFEKALPNLIAAHRGEFGLFRDGHAIAFFSSYHDAYVAGLDAFGIDVEFLIAEIKEQEPRPISVSWQSGVMFDPHE